MGVVGLTAAALFFAFYLFFNLTPLGQSLENGWAWKYEVFDTVGYWLRQHDLPPLSYDRATIVVGTLLAVAVAIARKHWRLAIWVAVATPGAVLASEGFKRVFDRPLLVDSRDDAVSYPSGHAVVVLAVAAALLIVVPAGWTRWVAPLLGVWMSLATSSIIVIGNHRPSEIIGAALLTTIIFTLIGAAAHLGLLDRPAPSLTHPAVAPPGRPGASAPSTWTRAGTIVLIAVAGFVAAWGALPWVTVVDGAAGAAASLLTLGIAFVMRSWSVGARATGSVDTPLNAPAAVNASTPS